MSSRIASNGKIVTIAAGNDASATLNYLSLFSTIYLDRALLDRGSPLVPEMELTSSL